MPRPTQVLAATLALSGTLVLAACATMPPVDTGGPYPPTAMQCDAERAHWAIGRAATAEVVEEVRAATQSRDVRVIHPGEAVTMDYRADRVNIHVNERNAITRITCG